MSLSSLQLVHELECFTPNMIGQTGINYALDTSTFDIARGLGLEVEDSLRGAEDRNRTDCSGEEAAMENTNTLARPQPLALLVGHVHGARGHALHCRVIVGGSCTHLLRHARAVGALLSGWRACGHTAHKAAAAIIMQMLARILLGCRNDSRRDHDIGVFCVFGPALVQTLKPKI